MNLKKYFYSKSGGNRGPFTIEELKLENITIETPIWFEGLDDWKLAKDIAELIMIPIFTLFYLPFYFARKKIFLRN